MADFEEVPEHLVVNKPTKTDKREEISDGSEVPEELIVAQEASPVKEPDDTIPLGAGAALGAAAGAKMSGLVGGGYGAKTALDAAMAWKNADKAPELAKLSGMQRYLNPLLEPLGVADTHYIPLDKFAQEMGLPKEGVVGPRELQAAVREAQAVKAVPAQRVPVETSKGRIFKTIPGTPGREARDLSHLIEPIPTVEQAAKAKAAAAAAPVAEDATKLAKMKASLQNAGRAITPAGTLGKIINTAAPVLSMAGAGTEAVDAYNRFKHGDYGRGIVSSIGALGSAASMIPHPITRAVGTGAALAAPAINAVADYFMPPKYAEGGVAGKYVGTPLRAGATAYNIGEGIQNVRQGNIGAGASQIGAGGLTALAPMVAQKLSPAVGKAMTGMGALPIVGRALNSAISPAEAAPMKTGDAALSAADLATSMIRGPAGMALSLMKPTELGSGDVYPGRQGTNPLKGTGSVMEHYVPRRATGGSIMPPPPMPKNPELMLQGIKASRIVKPQK